MFSVLKKIFDFSGSRRGLLWKAIGVSFLGAVFASLQFGALLLALEAMTGDRPAPVAAVLAIMLVSIAGRMACFYWSTNAETAVGYHMVGEKRLHIGDRLRYIPMGYFDKNSLGSVTATVTTTLSLVENSAARALVVVLGGFLNTMVLSLGLTWVDWRMGLLAIAGILCYLGATELSQRAMVRTAGALQRAQNRLIGGILEYIQGMGVVRSYGLEKDSGQAVFQAVDESCRTSLGLELSLVPWAALRRFTVWAFGVVLALCALVLYDRGSLSLARVLLMLVVSFLIYRELENAGNVSDMLQLLRTAMDQANAVDDTPVMDIDGTDAAPADASVELRDVSFAYGDRKILNHVSFAVPAGSTCAIVGPSGGGKTTLCSLIARFWDVQGGSVRVGGRDVRDYKLDSLMKQISMVFQDVYLFQDTVENNIKFGCPQATREQVIAAAKAACCHELISALPQGYDTVLGEGGGTLSGGEKQRISIARCLLKDAPIIILDEATASIDPENEAELQAALAELTRGKTLIMIAHRLKTVQNADQILVLDGGGIVQRGTHAELSAQPGLYADFIHIRQEAQGWRLA